MIATVNDTVYSTVLNLASLRIQELKRHGVINRVVLQSFEECVILGSCLIIHSSMTRTMNVENFKV